MQRAVTVVIVVFNSSSTIRTCLDCIPQDCEVVVIDQQSSDDSMRIVRETRPDATIVKAARNAGYSAGCNLGARLSRGTTLIFLNPDAAFRTPEGPHILSHSARARNALVAPIVVDSHGSDITAVRKWSTARAVIRDHLSLNRPERGFRNLSDGEYVSGPCLAITAGNFWAIGGFDERFFLYREEETLARRLENVGVGRFLDPRVTVSHIGGVSTSQVAKFSYHQSVRSEVLFYVLHFPKYAAALCALSLTARLLAKPVAGPLLRRLRARTQARPASWHLSALVEVISGWRAKPVEPPDLP